MKKVLFILFFLITLSFFSFAQIRVLFIGNSYTSVNNLPQLILNCAKSAGDNMEYSANTPGGYTFQNHLTSSAPYIQEGNWDYVVLQEQSQIPSFLFNQFMSVCYPYAQQLCQMIRQYNSNAQIVFYMTWGRKNGDQQNAVYYPVLGTYQGMDSLLYARYMMLAEDNDAVVSPVGALWHYIRDNYPQIQLYQSDESHPSMAGSYAAACSFYSVLFKKNPNLITYVPSSIEPDIADIIRQAAKTVVYDSLSKWLFVPQDDTMNIADTTFISFYEKPKVEIYPNPAHNNLFVNFYAPSHTDITINIYSISGQLMFSEQTITSSTNFLDISTIPSGSYILKAFYEQGCFYSKPIIITK